MLSAALQAQPFGVVRHDRPDDLLTRTVISQDLRALSPVHRRILGNVEIQVVEHADDPPGVGVAPEPVCQPFHDGRRGQAVLLQPVAVNVLIHQSSNLLAVHPIESPIRM
jgi:hypothetical protein